MCTLTWWSDYQGRYEVFFNRDERKTREAALPPRELRCGEDVRLLAPIDPRGGGTWLAVNEAGVTIALLNWYEEEPGEAPKAGWRSRGRLVTDLADAGSAEELAERISRIDAGSYPPFRVAGFALDEAGGFHAFAWEWSRGGCLLPIQPLERPLCSSSYETGPVIGGRRARLEAWAMQSSGELSPDELWRYHHGENPEAGVEVPSAWSVRMDRSDAQTWSISRVSVGPEAVNFLYEAESPGLGEPGIVTRASLPRRRREVGR